MNIMKKKIPDRIFKYMSINAYTIQSLATRHLFFCALDRLNDPFEGRINFDINRKDLEKVVASGKDSKTIGVKDAQFFLTLPNSDYKALSHRLPKTIRSKIAVCCFSEWQSHVLMFAHYGNLTGICLEFDTTMNKDFHNLVAVNYESTREMISFAFPTMKQIAYMGAQKDEIWRYEKEWRLGRRGEGQVPFDFGSLVSVTFGPNAKMEDKATVMRLLHDLNVNFFDCSVGQGKKMKLGRKKIHLPKKFLRN
jgi:Protein of unknown function (DUF2971)